MLVVEPDRAGRDWYVAFEYTGPDGIDYLDEADGGTPQRGAHATAADAAVAFVDREGVRHLLLIEWKYTEQYRGHRLSADIAGKRSRRYADKAFVPNGPIRSGLKLDDFFHEPFYQLLRQQMLAWRIERHADGWFDRVRVVHLSPSRNRALRAVTAPMLAEIEGTAQTDAFQAFRACLVDPDALIERSIEDTFAAMAEWPEATWFPALAARYPSLCDRTSWT